MQFKQYPSYKDSGVEWLGDVPDEWNIKRFNHVFKENKQKNIGLEETNVLSLSYGNIKEKNIDDNKGLLPESFETYQIIEPNDIVFRFTDLQNDKRSLRSAISKYHGIITSAYIGVKTNENADFYNYLFRAYDLQKVYYSMGEGMRQSLKMDELNKMPIVVPQPIIQQKIVSFLDTETTRIDNLITKQEKLIKLLEEQRKSIISHAVTKGLDPNAPMKDSGVEWLGEVSTDSTLIRFKFLAEINGRIGFRGYTTSDIVGEGEGAITLSPSNLNYKDLDLTKKTFLSWEKFYESPEIQIKPNDVIIVKTGSSLGKIGWVNALPHDLTINPQLAIIRCKKSLKANPKFLFYTMLSDYFKASVVSSNTGGTMPTVTQESIGKIIIPHYSIDFQNQIVRFLDSKCNKIDTLISKQKELIEKLKIYRTSIISHAVTGKIDVREFNA